MKSKLFNDWSTLRNSDWSTQKGPNKSKNNKLPVATRFLGSFDGNGGVYYALFKKPAGDSEKKAFLLSQNLVNLKPFDDNPGKT